MKIISTLFYLVLSFTASAQVNEIMRLTYFGGRQEKKTGLCGMKRAVDNSPRIPLTGNHPVKLDKNRDTLNLPGRSGGIYFLSQEKMKATEELIVTAKCTPKASNFKVNNDSLPNASIERKGSGLQIRSQPAAKLGSPKPIRLRCGGYTGPDPIYIVDGAILPNIHEVDNDDIEDITVLPSPQAQAIFGPSGKYGAIVITLKMRYHKISIKDYLDQTPIAKATVSFVRPERRDTLRYIADDSGVVVSNSLAKLGGCEMIVSATGFKTDTRTFNLNKPDSLHKIFLIRDIKICPEAIITCFDCIRTIRCGNSIAAIKSISNVRTPQIKRNSFSVFPNPAKRGSYLTVQKEFDHEEGLQLKVFYSDGRLLKTQSAKATIGLNRFIVSTENHWPAGIYFIQLLYENGRLAASGKIVVQ